MTSAPYLAQRTLKQLSYDEENKLPVAAPVLRSNFYMDDALCGAETLEEAKQLQHQLTAILKSAGMELHKIYGNHSELSQCINGIYDFSRPNETTSWDPVRDTFSLLTLYLVIRTQREAFYQLLPDYSILWEFWDPWCPKTRCLW
ncbi:uncharacterized protein TNCV_3869591 [Trichonephila clavipes]|nr:uncharacterized protein TNCV_3869591 [Trichonephila clavipes]